MADSESAREVRLDKEREAEERRLIEAAQQDRARFVEIYEKYFDLVYAYTARRTLNRNEAEDLTAEVFRKALESLARFKWTGAPFGAWLLRIASNLIADRAKRAARERGSGPGDTPSLMVEQPARSQPRAKQTQQTDLEEAERRAHLFRLVDGLSGDQRSVVVMRFAEERSIREIADELGRSEGAVKQLQLRALQNLRAKLVSQTK
ncbi:MAG TPA: sigma-70 family RNA polymerase sigma factor [Pyrinomonadaceae bacterium]|nr:sigma-70 family RNA polymerase sigma factor [Pyrinomonadaceae bacterium]